MENIPEEVKEKIKIKLCTKIKCFEKLEFHKTAAFLASRLSFMTQDQDKNITEDKTMIVNQEADMCYYNGYMMEKKKDMKEAIKHYKRALIIEPFFYEVYQRLFIDKLIKNEEGNEILNEIAFEEHDEWLKLIYYCRFNQDMAEIKKMRDYFEKFNKVIKKNKYINIDTNDDIVDIIQSEAYYNKGSYLEAYVLSKSVVNKSSNESYLIFIESAYKLNKKTALDDLSLKLKDDSERSSIYAFMKGLIFLLEKKYAEARRELIKASRSEELLIISKMYQGILDASKNSSHRAINIFEEIQQICPGWQLPSFYIGLEMIKLNEYDKAMEYFDKALVICMTDPMIYVEYGCLFVKLKKYIKAKEYLIKALNLIEDENKYNECYSKLYLNLGHCASEEEEEANLAMNYYRESLCLSRGPLKYDAIAAIAELYHKNNYETEALNTLKLLPSSHNKLLLVETIFKNICS